MDFPFYITFNISRWRFEVSWSQVLNFKFRGIWNHDTVITSQVEVISDLDNKGPGSNHHAGRI